MPFETIYTDKAIEITEIKAALSVIFPGLSFYHWDFMEDSPETMDVDKPEHILFNTNYLPEKLEFGFSISVYRLPESNSQERELYLGQHFHSLMHLRFLVGFRKPDEPDDPYYDILFQNGTSFLVDDCDTSFGDGTENPVRIIGEYRLPELKFDDKGNFLND